MKKYLKKFFIKRGFTLIELIVVILIISILGSIVMINISSARGKARNAFRLASLNQVEKAIELYRNDHNGEPPGVDGVEYVNGDPNWIPGLVPDYMPELPSDPINNGAHKFHYFRHGHDYGVMAFLEEYGDVETCDDGGSSCQYSEITSGDSIEISNPGESDWSFTDSTEIVYMTCPNINEQVTICHRLQENSEHGVTLTVSCDALGPQGHSNHEYDTLGACIEEITDPTTTLITATTATGGTISPSGEVEVITGASASFNISADNGYAIASLIIDGQSVDTSSTYTFSDVQSSHTINVTFYLLQIEVPDYHSFSITSGPNGTITSVSTSVTRGDDITFNIIPDAGYQVESFSIDGVNVDSPSETYTFTNVLEDHAISATFSQLLAECPVTLTPDLATYTSGSPVQITWDETCYPSSRVLLEVRKMTDSGSTSYIMIYSGADNDGSYPYQGFPGATIGSEHWVVRVTNDSPRTILNESSQFMVEASTPTTEIIETSVSTGGAISPSGQVEVVTGTNASFSISPDSGYEITLLTIDGATTSIASSYTFSNVQSSHTISAIFAPLPVEVPDYHSFSITSGPNGTITSVSTSVTRGDDITFNITPDAGYQVESFSIDGVNVDSPSETYTFTNVLEDHAISATFSLTPAELNLDLLTITGRFIDMFTQQPVTNVIVRMSLPLQPFLLNVGTNGEFTYSTTTTDILPSTHKGILYTVSCYKKPANDPLATIVRNADNSLDLYTQRFNEPLGSRYIKPISTNPVDLGNIELWPAKSFTLNSDIPVKFSLIDMTGGNTLYKLQHNLTDAIPLDLDVAVMLTDASGNTYASPTHRYDQESGCTRSILNFSEGEFTWE